MNTTSLSHAPRSGERALVLGGGGSAGNAWLLGVVAGLLEGGLDVTGADLTIGTSAGATTAAQIAGASPAELYEATLAAPPRLASRRPEQGADAVRRPPAVNHLVQTDAIIAASSDLADMRRRIGTHALRLAEEAGADQRTRWHDTVRARLPSDQWPQRAMLLTAVDADTGEPVDLDRDSGVDLVDAVAASCAGGPAYAIGERRYVDGGYRRSSENADLAAGYERVLVLSPLGGRVRHPAAWRTDLATQVAELRAGGSRVETILPDTAALAAFGDNMMNLAARPGAARAGHDQGLRCAGRVGDLWR